MPASAQEQFVAELTQHSLGAPFLFEPETYRKGGATREPADLAWVCRDSLFLINMQHSDVPYEKQVQHNLRQLRGWLRMWSLGERLKGHNDWQTFDLTADSAECLLLISVVHGEDSRLEVMPYRHHERESAVEAKVAFVAVLPDVVLLELARRGGSALDLADLLLRIAAMSGTATLQDGLEMLEEHHREAFARAEADSVDRGRDEELYRSVLFTIARGLRTMPASGENLGEVNLSGSIAVFNDLDWESTARLSLRTTAMIQGVRDVPLGTVGPTQMACVVELPPYRFVVGAADIRHVPSFGLELSEVLRRLEEETPESPPISLTYQLVGRPEVQFMSSVMSFPKRSAPSLTRLTLLDGAEYLNR